MKRITLITLAAVAVLLLAYAWIERPVECSHAANLMGRTDALFACLMQR